jgi:hypothetical protein
MLTALLSLACCTTGASSINVASRKKWRKVLQADTGSTSGSGYNNSKATVAGSDTSTTTATTSVTRTSTGKRIDNTVHILLSAALYNKCQ